MPIISISVGQIIGICRFGKKSLSVALYLIVIMGSMVHLVVVIMGSIAHLLVVIMRLGSLQNASSRRLSDAIP